MLDNIYINVLLTILTVATGITTLLSFANVKRESNKTDDEKRGELQSDIKYIKSVVEDVRQGTKEINRLLDSHNERIARVEESCKQAHKRISEHDKKFERIEESRG